MNNDFFHSLFEVKGVRASLVGALILLSLFLLSQTAQTLEGLGRASSPATDTITVQGNGQATLPPDVARVSFTVQNTSATVADAQDATTKQANSVLDFVKEQGVADKDVKTLSYNISPQYSYPNPCVPGALCPEYSHAPKVIGYQVSETVQVTVRDLSVVGELLEGLGKLSVQNVNGPAFALDDPTAGYDAARADAIAKAKKQASLLSGQLDVRLGKIVSFSEYSGGYSYPMMAYGMGGGIAETKALSPSVPTGENTYTASVSITYEIR